MSLGGLLSSSPHIGNGGGGQRGVTVQLWIGFPGKRQVHLFSHLARDRGRFGGQGEVAPASENTVCCGADL